MIVSLSGLLTIFTTVTTAAMQSTITTPIYLQLAEAAMSGAAGAIVKEAAKRRRQQQLKK